MKDFSEDEKMFAEHTNIRPFPVHPAMTISPAEPEDEDIILDMEDLKLADFPAPLQDILIKHEQQTTLKEMSPEEEKDEIAKLLGEIDEELASMGENHQPIEPTSKEAYRYLFDEEDYLPEEEEPELRATQTGVQESLIPDAMLERKSNILKTELFADNRSVYLPYPKPTHRVTEDLDLDTPLPPRKRTGKKSTKSPKHQNQAVVSKREHVASVESTTASMPLPEAIPNELFAGFLPRMVAFLIDISLIFVFCQAVVKNLFLFSNIPTNSFAYDYAYLTVYLLYFVLLTKLAEGQTIGKLIMGIKVVSLNEASLSWGTVLTRELFGRYILKVIPLLYLICPFTTKKQQTADLFAETSVVSLKMVRLYEKAAK